MVSLVRRMLDITATNVAISTEEARTAIKALEHSAQAMPDGNETIGAHRIRVTREKRLAMALRARLGSPLS